MEKTLLPTLEICTAPAPDASIIWLHGLGADGYDFAPIVDELVLPIAVRFVLPHAPARAITLYDGYRMPAWYDVQSKNICAVQDADGIRHAQQMIELLIAQENQRGIPSSRIMLAGFSQGGAIALQTGLRHAARLAGIIALSTYLPLAETLDGEKSTANTETPIFMAHGTMDEVIAQSAGRAACDLLSATGQPVAWHEYAMAHSVCAAEIADIRSFILESLAAV